MLIRKHLLTIPLMRSYRTKEGEHESKSIYNRITDQKSGTERS